MINWNGALCLFLLLFLCASLGSCMARPGTADALSIEMKFNGQMDTEGLRIKTADYEITLPPGYDAKIETANGKQPTPADETATAKVDGAEASSGDAGKTASAIGLAGTLWIGIGLIILGGLIFLAKRAGVASMLAGPSGVLLKLAGVLPKGSGIGLIILGGAVIILPWFLDTIQPLVIPAVATVVGILLIWWIYNIIDEKNGATDAAGDLLPHPAFDEKPTNKHPARSHA